MPIELMIPDNTLTFVHMTTFILNFILIIIDYFYFLSPAALHGIYLS